jgi:mono/diheme cytochrome c family protein
MTMSQKKNMLRIASMLVIVMLSLVTAVGLSQSTTQPGPSTPTATKASKPVAAHATEDEGARIFAQNCARCHNAPDGFSSRISGSVVRHMRVRASLSKHDEEELLRFFNP